MSSLLSFKDFQWRHAGRAKPAIRDINLDISAGERVLIVGTSGAGKSTLLSACAGLLGSEEDGEQSGTRHCSTRVGLVLQDPDSQAVAARVGDDTAFGLENLQVPQAKIWPRVKKALSVVGLLPRIDLERSTRDLSGGQKQRLALAGVLAMHPGIIALDEPTANIDPESIPDIVSATAEATAASGAALIIVEHHVEPWLELIDRIIVCDKGRIIADGPQDQILQELGPTLRESGVWVPGPAPALPSSHPPQPESPLLLSTTDLSIGWSPEHPVQTGLDLSIPTGCGVCVTGANGAGKSTLALTLGGLIPALSGTVEAAPPLCRGLASTSPLEWRSKDLAQRIGFVFQNPEHQFLCRTVREELEFGGTDPEWVDELLDRLGLRALEQASPFTLSGGEKRRLSVATALCSAPQLLILDEPTFGQDRHTFKELVCLLRALCDEGKTVLSVTHDPLVVKALGDMEIRL